MNAPESRLQELQRAAGGVVCDTATTAPFVAHFGSPQSEYDAAHSGAVVFDLSDRSQIDLTGKDRQHFLHNFCTNDINSLKPGQGCEAFVTNVKGRVLAHIYVFAATDRLVVESVAAADDSLLSHLDRYLIREDVQLNDESAVFGELFVSGSQSVNCLAPFEAAVESLAIYEHVSTKLGSDQLRIRRVDWLDQPGFLVCVARSRLADLWSLLTEANVRPAGSDVFDALRIEAGTPLYGRDISENNLAQEVGRSQQAISFTKGCYLGQEPIARIDAMGHVNRELRRLKIESGPVPQPNTVIVEMDGKSEVGVVTSAALLPREQKPVALAYLRRKVMTPGTTVCVAHNDVSVRATVF